MTIPISHILVTYIHLHLLALSWPAADCFPKAYFTALFGNLQLRPNFHQSLCLPPRPEVRSGSTYFTCPVTFLDALLIRLRRTLYGTRELGQLPEEEIMLILARMGRGLRNTG